MSTNYSFRLSVGFEIGYDQILKKYGKYLPEMSHMEDRFDPRTGKKSGQEKVVDHEAGVRVVIGGESFGRYDTHEMVEALEKELGAFVEVVNDAMSVSSVGNSFMISPRGLNFKDPSRITLDYGDIMAQGGLLIDDLVRKLPQFEELGLRLKKLGFKPGKLMARIVGGYG
jgi:hypothetical protein